MVFEHMNPVEDDELPAEVLTTPNRKAPWCPACQRHTEYHLKVVGWDQKSGMQKTAPFYTCNECGGDTWKPTNPMPINVVSALLFGFLLLVMCPYVLTQEEPPESLLIILLTGWSGYGLYKNSRKNNKHWKEFRAWARKNRA